MFGIAIIAQYENGVVFRFGKYHRTLQPGLNFYIPLVESVRPVNMRTFTKEMPPQDAVTKDTVPIKIRTTLWYRITDAMCAVVKVQDVERSIENLAPAVLRSVIGSYTLETVLHDSAKITEELRSRVEETVKEWGVDITRVEMPSVDIPESLQRAIAAEAEADRERKARIIKADAEFQAAQKLADAAKIIAEYPEAMELRRLEMISQVGAEHNTTTIVMIPSAFLDAASAFSRKVSAQVK